MEFSFGPVALGCLALLSILYLLICCGERVLDRLAARRQVHIAKKLRQRLDRLNEDRRARGLGYFPTLDELRRLAAEQAEELGFTPDGVESEMKDRPGLSLPVFDGIQVVPETARHPISRMPCRGVFVQRPRYYQYRWHLHRSIVIFYGSFLALYAGAPRADILEALKAVVEHELQHTREADMSLPYRRSLAWRDWLKSMQIRKLRRGV